MGGKEIVGKNNKKEIIRMILKNNPDIHTRPILPEDDDDTIKDKQRKMFITGAGSQLEIYFSDKTTTVIYAPKNYSFDGATIPFKIGKGNMKLQIPALFHDIICDNKSIVEYNRALSSEIFYKALLLCHVNKVIAIIMFFFVDNFQKLMDWNNK